MKTVTFSGDQVRLVKVVLKNRVCVCEANVAECMQFNVDYWLMYWRDQLDIARQAIALVES